MTVIRVGVAGLGAIGRVVARHVSKGIPGLTLTAVAARDQAKAHAWLEHEKIKAPLVELDALPQHCDLAVECAPAAALEPICRPMLAAGKRVMVLSAGALLPRADLIELAAAKGGQIIVPTGALLGLDAVTAAAEGEIRSVRMTTRKPPSGLAGAPYLVANDISVEGLNAPKRVFVGTAREAAKGLRELGRIEPPSRSGRIPVSPAIATASRSTRTRRGSHLRSRTCPRRTRGRAGLRRCPSSRRCANLRRHYELGPSP